MTIVTNRACCAALFLSILITPSVTSSVQASQITRPTKVAVEDSPGLRELKRLARQLDMEDAATAQNVSEESEPEIDEPSEEAVDEEIERLDEKFYRYVMSRCFKSIVDKY